MIITWILHLILASSIATFQLPDGLANGLYRAYNNDQGEEIIQYLGDVNTTLPNTLEEQNYDIIHHASDSHGPERRDFKKRWQSKCGCGIHLDHGDTDRAVQGLKDSASRGGIIFDKPESAVFVWYNSVVAFVCWGPSWTFIRDIAQSCSFITKECDWYVAGSANYFWDGMVEGQFNDAMTPGDMGYMSNRATQICENE
ncbi:hypothetical protein B0H66DRAFT_219490 [Apodospora peruviana]|uniref:Uncharacterized protein n=1 Tax=Apodospora peruviana TaxID=516989 RepID=A0AAE0M8Q9_9PEZI|nr:hypothetical protein B0H66DRAFT_219490 [Apodospora peruviana]